MHPPHSGSIRFPAAEEGGTSSCRRRPRTRPGNRKQTAEAVLTAFTPTARSSASAHGRTEAGFTCGSLPLGSSGDGKLRRREGRRPERTRRTGRRAILAPGFPFHGSRGLRRFLRPLASRNALRFTGRESRPRTRKDGSLMRQH